MPYNIKLKFEGRALKEHNVHSTKIAHIKTVMQDMKEFVIQFRSWFWGRFFKHNANVNIACLASNALCLRTKKIHHFYTEAFQIFMRQLFLLNGGHASMISCYRCHNNVLNLCNGLF